MLRSLSGNTHSVFTGVTIIKGEKQKTFSQETKVTFYDLSDEEIYEYVDSGDVYDKAGSYGIQGKGGLLVKGINGDYFNVVGLPVARLQRELEDFKNT
jgi:septum formation protein